MLYMLVIKYSYCLNNLGESIKDKFSMDLLPDKVLSFVYEYSANLLLMEPFFFTLSIV